MREARNKIVSRQSLKHELAEHKRRGECVVFANGCFDVLHVGHVRYLEGARREGDVLVVGINSDVSVTPLKGADRPVLPAGARAQLVAAIAAVNYVTIFDEPDVTTLLEALRPD